MFIRSMIFRDAASDAAAAAAGGGGGDGTSVKINNAAAGGGAAAYTPPEFKADFIPPDYRDKPYIKDVKDFPTLFKNYDELQTKLGQRPSVGAPAADAKPEDVEKFYSSLRPKDAKEYTFTDTEETKKTPRDETAMGMIKTVFHEAGISAYQANKLLPGLEKFMVDYAAGKTATDDKAFEDAVTKHFQGNVEPSLKIAKELIAESVPKEYLSRLEKLPNDALLLMTMTMKSVHDKYIKEDGTTPPGGSTTVGDVTALRAKAIDLQKSEAFKDFRHPNHDATIKEVEDLYQKIAGFQPVEKKD